MAIRSPFIDDNGVTHSLTIQELIDQERSNAVNAAYNNTAPAFYPNEQEPYRAAMIASGYNPTGVSVDEEIERRYKEGKIFNENNHNLDIYIGINKVSLSRLRGIVIEEPIPEIGTTTTTPISPAITTPSITPTTPTKQPFHLGTEDPARVKEHYSKVDNSIPNASIALTPKRDWSSQNMLALQTYMVQNKILGGMAYNPWVAGSFYASKGSTDTVNIFYILMILGALYSYAAFKSKVQTNDHRSYRDIWWGNTLNFSPLIDGKSSRDIREIYPTATFDNGYKTIIVPKILSYDDFGKLVAKHLDYLKAVRDYWMQAIENIPNYTTGGKIMLTPAMLAALNLTIIQEEADKDKKFKWRGF